MATLRSDLTRIALQARELVSEALLQTAQDVYAISQDLCPVDTGLLKKSGGTDVTEIKDGDATTVVVGYGGPDSEREDVALWIEFGTSRMSAQPFLTPAFAQSETTFEANMKKAMDKLAK